MADISALAQAFIDANTVGVKPDTEWTKSLNVLLPFVGAFVGLLTVIIFVSWCLYRIYMPYICIYACMRMRNART